MRELPLANLRELHRAPWRGTELNGGGNAELVFNGYRVSVREVEKILEAA